MKCAAIVLAAGKSLRMGQTKALLKLGNRTLLEHVVHTCSTALLYPIVVVAGAQEEDGFLLTQARAQTLVGSPHVVVTVGMPGHTPIDSLRCGLRLVPPEHAVLLWPVDHPFADARVVKSLLQALKPGHIVVPRCQDRRGHPVIFAADVAQELWQDDLAEGARTVIRRDPQRVMEVPVTDFRIGRDLDTPQDAQELL